MSIKTDLTGRLRNTNCPRNAGMISLCEAVSNSIHAIEESDTSIGMGVITVRVMRDVQRTLDFERGPKKRGRDPLPPITGFDVTDNGVGFTDDNLASFETLDSTYKQSKGGRGVGRLMWLKVFEKITVESLYRDSEGKDQSREFSFNSTAGVTEKKMSAGSAGSQSTTIRLRGFLEKFREACPKTAATIADELLEHCLWYFVRPGGYPRITVEDATDVIALEALYDDRIDSMATAGSIELKGHSFELLHINQRKGATRGHSLYLCAANRVVRTEPLRGKVNGLFGPLQDDDGTFTYSCYVSSPFLDERVRSERTSFDLVQDDDSLFTQHELTYRDIVDAICSNIAEHLAPRLKVNLEDGKRRVSEFVSKKAPRYRPILRDLENGQNAVDPNVSDKELELFLHKRLAEVENNLLRDGHDIMQPRGNEGIDEYEERLSSYLKQVKIVNQSDLAAYVSRRKVILDILENALKKGSDGKYEREGMIHDLIMPRGVDSTSEESGRSNLWLIDERLAFHDYLASDMPIRKMPITETDAQDRPDLLATRLFDTPTLMTEQTGGRLTSIVVVELKRPMRDDAASGKEKDPVEQALRYVKLIRDGKAKTHDGRPIIGVQNVPGFCYIICDLTPSVIDRCEFNGLTATQDGLGFFQYHPNYKTYVEVISFNRLVIMAKERNRAFFDRLNLPVT